MREEQGRARHGKGRFKRRTEEVQVGGKRQSEERGGRREREGRRRREDQEEEEEEEEEDLIVGGSPIYATCYRYSFTLSLSIYRYPSPVPPGTRWCVHGVLDHGTYLALFFHGVFMVFFL